MRFCNWKILKDVGGDIFKILPEMKRFSAMLKQLRYLSPTDISSRGFLWELGTFPVSAFLKVSEMWSGACSGAEVPV